MFGIASLSKSFTALTLCILHAEGVLDLSERIAARPEFGMTQAELDALLQPDRYIGRCREQVERFLEQVKPRLAGAGEADADIPV